MKKTRKIKNIGVTDGNCILILMAKGEDVYIVGERFGALCEIGLATSQESKMQIVLEALLENAYYEVLFINEKGIV